MSKSDSEKPDTFVPPSDSFCVLPWIHLSTRPNGHMRLCCTANASSVGATNDKEFGGEVGVLKKDDGKPANLNTTDLLSAWNNSFMKGVRLQMLSGQQPPSCRKCFKEEAAGYKSKRNWETAYWAHRLDVDKLINETDPTGAVPAQIAYVDLRLGTKCNLKCVMCSPHDSSLWVNDWNKIYPQVKNSNLKETMSWENKGQVNGASYRWHIDNPQFWSQLYDQLPNMKQLYFAGGEPLIIDEHYEILEECIKRGYAKNIELRYNSNGQVLPERLFELWNQFQKVRFNFSIDSLGERNHYIRYPADWKTTVDHLWRLDSTPDHVEVFVACAVQALNVHDIPEMIDWKLDQGFKKINPWPFGGGLIGLHFVYHPPHLNVKALPSDLKQTVRQKYEEYYPRLERYYQNSERAQSPYAIPRLKAIIRFMESEDWSNRWPEFVEYFQILDKARGTSLEKTFPWLSPHISNNFKTAAL